MGDPKAILDAAPDWKGFGEAIMEEWQAHCAIEPEDKFDLAVEFNILRQIPGGFDPEQHIDCYGCAEPGDDWYEMNPAPDLAAEVLRLRAEVERLTEAAEYFAQWDHCWPGNINLETACEKTRAALKAKGTE